MHSLTGFRVSFPALLLAILTMLSALPVLAAPAGRIDFAAGSITATALDGTARALVKGAEINNGDSINTGADGRAHIRFTDDSYLSLQPNTLFKIETYAFNGKSDGSEKAFFNLVKGGLRKITGAIGKVNKQNYAVVTPTATIGIRGTTYSALQTDEGLTVTVGQGLVAVSNDQGSLTLGSGQSAFVSSQGSSPVMTNEKVLLQQQEVPNQDQADTTIPLSEDRREGGGLAALPVSEPTSPAPPPAAPAPSPPPPPPPPPSPVLVTGTGYSVAYAASDALGSPPGTFRVDASSATFDGGGTLLDFSDGTSSISFDGAAQETGSDALIGWGRWTGAVSGTTGGTGTYAGAEGFHYVTGQPTATANLNLGSNAVVNYSLIGHTLPTTAAESMASSGGIAGAGTVSVTFSAAPTMTMNFDIVTAPHTYQMALTGATTLSMSGGGQATFLAAPNGAACASSCSIQLNGLFAGTAGERVGFAYEINDQVGITKGSIAFASP